MRSIFGPQALPIGQPLKPKSIAPPSSMVKQSRSATVVNAMHSSSDQQPPQAKSPESRLLRSWRGAKEKLGTCAVYLLFGWPVLLVVCPIIYVPCYRASCDSVEFTVDSRERVATGSGDSTRSYYLVWSGEGEVYCVCDSWSYLSFDASDRYGRLREGSHVKAQVAGWRVPFLSWYRNIIAIETIVPRKSEIKSGTQ